MNEVQLDSKALAEAVAWARQSVADRPTVPILGGIPLRVDGDKLIVSGFDYERSSEMAVPVTGDADGERVLVSGRLLTEIAKALPSGQVTLSFDDKGLSVKGGSARFTLLGMPVEDYPVLPAQPPMVGVVEGSVFARAVSRVAYATSDSAPGLMGVLIKTDGGRLLVAASDRYRLPVCEVPWEPSGADTAEFNVSVMAGFLTSAAKTLGADAKVELRVSDSLFGMDAGWRHATSRLIAEGNGAWLSVLGRVSGSTGIEVDVAELKAAVSRVALVTDKIQAVVFTPGDGELTISAFGGGTMASAEEAIPAVLSGPDIETRFMPRYLLDALDSMDSERVHIQIATAGKPTMWTPVVPEGHHGGYRHLVMPVRPA